MLSRNEVALLNRALLREATEAFQKQLLPFPTAQAADCISVSCQLLILPSQNSRNLFSWRYASNAAALWRTAAVVRDGRDVADHHDVQTRSGQGAHGGLASRPRALHAHFHALHSILVARDAGSRERSLLGGVRGALARALEADGTRGRPAHGAAIRVGDGDLRVVERRSDVHQAMRNDTALPLLLELLLALRRRCRFCRCSGLRRCGCGFRFFCHV